MKAYIKDDFKNLLEYQEWVNKRMDNLSNINLQRNEMFDRYYLERQIKHQPQWFGNGVTYSELKAGVTEYKNPELITKIYNKVNDTISAEVRDQIKARKVKYNPYGLGVFCFDRVAMGMYRLKEYYSPSLKKVVENDEVIVVNDGYELISDRSEVIKRWEEQPNGKPKVRTTNKNVYAYFPPVPRDNHAVEMYISCGGHVGIQAEQFLYSGISAIIVAQLLEKARIKTRISIVIGSSPDAYQKTAYGCIIPVKNYDEALDINLLALLTSDPRFFRYNGFQGVISTYDHFKTVCPQTLGTGLDKTFLTKMIEKSDYSKNAKIAPNRFYFGWTFSEKAATEEITKTINQIASKLNDK